jgi:YVTN family beta-propeller protein
MSGSLCLVLTACQPTPLLNYPAGFREFAYVANSAANTVTVLDLVYLRVDRTLAVGANPIALAVNPVRNEVYAVNQGSSTVSVLDTSSNQVRATIPVRHDPIAIAVDPTGQRAFVLSRAAATLSAIDLATDRTIFTVPTGDLPSGLALSSDGHSLVVSNAGQGSASVYEVSGSPALRLRAVFFGCPGAISPVIPKDLSKAFLACADTNQVMVLSLAVQPGTWNARQDNSLLTDHVLDLLDVGHHPQVITAKPDGGEIFVSNRDSDSMSEISTQTNEVESTYAIGTHPGSAIISADSSALWVANQGSNSLSLYSIDDGSLLPPVRTGSGPGALAFSADQALLLAADTGSGDVAVIRTQAKPGPGLLTILPAGSQPAAIVVKAMPAKTTH